MKEELTRMGIQELLTEQEVTDVLENQSGTALVVVNSVCGCAAGNARPGVALALQNEALPDRLFTVFAGQDVDATAKARSYLHGYPPSSPSIALMRNGEVVLMLERKDIEGRSSLDVAQDLKAAFDQHCSKQPH